MQAALRARPRRQRDVDAAGLERTVHRCAAERVAALLDLDMLLITGGAVRSASTLAALLEAAGFEDVATRPFGALGVLVEGRR